MLERSLGRAGRRVLGCNVANCILSHLRGQAEPRTNILVDEPMQLDRIGKTAVLEGDTANLVARIRSRRDGRATRSNIGIDSYVLRHEVRSTGRDACCDGATPQRR